jgi:Zn-dependent protease
MRRLNLRFSLTEAFELGRYEKAPIYLHPVFFITAILLAWPFWSTATVRGFALAVLFIIVILASVLLHELAHAGVARRYGVSASRIDIHGLGGLVQFWEPPFERSHDAAIAIAGPAANFVIGVVALALVTLTPPPTGIDDRIFSVLPTEHSFLDQILRAVAYLNLGLCAVNLIPAFPLDGGKLLYLLIEGRWGARPATLIVSVLGIGFSCVSMLAFVISLFAGYPVWAPPGIVTNWRAFQAARQGRAGWARNAIEA